MRPLYFLSFPVFIALLASSGCERTIETPQSTDIKPASRPAPVQSELPTERPESLLKAISTADSPDHGDAIVIDGSSTVFPITEAVASEFEKLALSVPIRLGVSGTGGGFKKFCRRELDITDASRPIKESEQADCRENGVDFVELPVAFDGVSVVVHAGNQWCSCVTVDELRGLWSPESEGRIQRWNQLRGSWPDQPIKLFGPGRDSGTFDYFTRAVVGQEGVGRGDFKASEDDYLLAQGVARDPYALGFFGYAYYQEYKDRLRRVAIDQGSGCVLPSEQTIADGTYRPLSRPVFIYVRAESLQRQEVRHFVDLYLRRAPDLVAEVGYVPLPARAYDLAQRRIQERRLGSVFDGGSQVGMSIEKVLAVERESELR